MIGSKAGILTLSGMLILSMGCSSLKYPIAKNVVIDEGEEHTLSYTSDIRAVHILNRNGKRWIIAEPPPDAAFAYTDQGGGISVCH